MVEIPFVELTEQEEERLERNIVWIFGANRSGTTWLARQLEASDCYFMNEPLLGEHLGISIRSKLRISIFKDFSVKLPISESINQSLGKSDSMIRQIDIQKNRSDYFFSDIYKETWKYFLRKLFLNRVFGQFKTLEKKIVIKEPNGTIGSDIITECFPNSKWILLLRDPRDILDSRVNALSKTGWSHKKGWNPITEENKIPFIERESLKWIQIIEIMMRVNHVSKKENCLVVKYEILRKNTTEELKKIFKFLETDLGEEQIKKIADKLSFENIPKNEKGTGKRRRSATPGKWKENFNDKEKKIMKKIMGKTIDSIGYEV